ncbi:MAG: hypothetical protein AMS15_09245 [Planctomycetes bacterium DG_23]|nr:MAG: hypothetical protein AMS15_09245 [Planctomycetes bacterium DG_23]
MPAELQEESPEEIKGRSRARIGILRLVALSSLGLLLAFGVILFLFTMEEHIVAQGTIIPDKKYEVRSLKSGVLIQVPVDPGERVQASALIAKLDDKTLKDRLSSNTHLLEEAQAQMQTAKTTLTRLEIMPLPGEFRFVELEVKEAQNRLNLAQKKMQRIEQLHQDGLASADDLDEAKSEYELAEVGLETALKKKEFVDKGLEEAILEEARAQVAEIEKKFARLASEKESILEELSQTELKTPYPGQVASRLKRRGEAVAAGELVAIIAIGDERRVEMMVDQTGFSRVRLGQEVRILSAQYPYRTYGPAMGKLDKIEPWARSSGSSGGQGGRPLYRLEAQITQIPEGLEGAVELSFGSTATCQIIVGRARIIDLILGRETRTTSSKKE